MHLSTFDLFIQIMGKTNSKPKKVVETHVEDIRVTNLDNKNFYRYSKPIESNIYFHH